MLKRIVIINSAIYAKADIQFDQVASIQLIGENNVGKSSLINTLNFLYMIDQRHMQFEGDRRLQDSLQHYFPSVQRSFILFELTIDGHFCILVRRTPDNQLEYYHIPQPYQASWFLNTKKQGEEIINFTQMIDKMHQQGIEMKKLDSAQLYHKVYSQEESEKPIVLLSSNATRRGRSYHNHFTQIYKHLIRSSRISANDLTQALLVAFNKAETELTIFSDRNHDSLEKLFNLHKKIDQLKKIESPFLQLKEVHAQFQTTQKALGKLYFAFQQNYPDAIKKISDLQEEVASKITQAQEKHVAVTQAIRLANQAIGAAQSEQSFLQQEQKKKQSTLQELTNHDTPLAKATIKEKMQQKLKEKQALEQIIDQVTHSQNASQDLQTLISRLERKRKAKQAQIKSFGDPLIHHIAQDPTLQSRLNAILSPELLYAPKSIIKKTITQITDKMTLFDGIIDIKKVQPKEDFISLPEIKAELVQIEHDLAAAQKLQKDRTALQKLEKEYEEQQKLWQLIQQKPALLQEERALQAAIEKVAKKMKQLQKEAKEKEESQQLHWQAVEQHKTKQVKYRNDLQRYQAWRQELDRMELPTIEEKMEVNNLEDIYGQATTYYTQRETSAKKRKLLFEQITQQLSRYDDNIDLFVNNTEKELASLDKLEESKTALVKGVLNNFVYPTQSFLADYHEFKKHIERFSKELSEHQISGIHKVELHLNELKSTLEELEEISRITTEGKLDFNQKENTGIATLQRYIDQKANFHLKDLFRLQLRMTLQENTRPIHIDTNKQIQSYGTDKVLRLIIFLQILQELIAPQSDRRIVIYVDEVGTLGTDNIQKLLSFCQTANVLPIFASTKFIEGFQKYYTLLPTTANEGKVWVDERHAIKVTN